MRERSPNSRPGNSLDRDHRGNQLGRMWLAVVVLLAAFAVILVKDHWFSYNSEEETGDRQASPSRITDQSRPSEKIQSTPEIPANKRKQKGSATRTDQRSVFAAPPAVGNAKSPLVKALEVRAPSEITKRVLPADRRDALLVETPANSGHWKIWLGTEPNPGSGAVTNAAERAPLPFPSTDTDHEPSDRVYPVLRKQMRARGSVVLRATVNSDGAIESLRVLSGPAILAPAAREAVRQWRFKPYFQNGRAVETQAEITVNFLISTT